MPQPRSSIRALRAIGALFLIKLAQPLLLMVVIVLIALYALTIMLSLSFSGWWLLLLIVLVPITVIGATTGYAGWFVLQRLLPRKLEPFEKRKVNGFIDTLFSLAERAKLPYFMLLFLVAKDVLRGKESKFLSKLIGDSKSVLKEFENIQDLFKS